MCVLCRGFDCSLESRCDECREWSSEEMEAYVKHRQLLLRKDRCRKDSLPKPPSSPMTSPSHSQPTPLSAAGVDDRIDAKLAALSTSFNQKLDSLTSVLLARIAMSQAPSELSVSARMSNNLSSTAPQAVPIRCPSPGLDLPPLKPVDTVSYHRELLADGVGPVPSDDRVPFPLEQVYVRERGSASSADAQVPSAATEVPAPARFASFVSADARAPPPVAEPASASSNAPFADDQASPSTLSACPLVRHADPPVAGPSTPGPAEKEDDDGASVVFNLPVMDKTVARLAAFIHDQYLESPSLSAPSLAPRLVLR